MRLKSELDEIKPGQTVSITVSDPGFISDIPAWCESTGNCLIKVTPENGKYTAVISKKSDNAKSHLSSITNKKKTTRELKLEVQNVTNNKGLVTEYYNSRKQEIEKSYQLPMFPVVSYRIDF